MPGLVAALLMVVIHNAASVPDEMLGATKRHLERIFAGAEIRIAWANVIEADAFRSRSSCAESRQRDLARRRRPRLGPPRRRITRGGSRFVFYARVLQFAHQHNRPVDLILAYAIAHEFGHVLLPAPAHTVAGLKKPNGMKTTYFGNVDRLFTVEQTARMSSAIEGGRVTK